MDPQNPTAPAYIACLCHGETPVWPCKPKIDGNYGLKSSPFTIPDSFLCSLICDIDCVPIQEGRCLGALGNSSLVLTFKRHPQKRTHPTPRSGIEKGQMLSNLFGMPQCLIAFDIGNNVLTGASM